MKGGGYHKQAIKSSPTQMAARTPQNLPRAEPAFDRVKNQDKVNKHERRQHYGREALRDI